MHLLLKNLKQQEFHIEIESDKKTVKDLKLEIEKVHNFDSSCIKLLHSGVVLEDPKTLEEYKIKEGNVIIMMILKPKKTEVKQEPNKNEQANPQQQMIPQGQQPVLLQQYLQNQQPFIYQHPYGQPIIVGQQQMVQPSYIIVNQPISRPITTPSEWPIYSADIKCPYCSEKVDTKTCFCFNVCTCLLYVGICLLIPLAICNGNAGNCSCSKDQC